MPYAFSNAAANASSESERNRFRRIPRSTSANRSDAAVIHSKSADSAIRFNSDAISRFRTNSGAPASIDARSRNSEYRVRINAQFSPAPPPPDGTSR